MGGAATSRRRPTTSRAEPLPSGLTAPVGRPADRSGSLPRRLRTWRKASSPLCSSRADASHRPPLHPHARRASPSPSSPVAPFPPPAAPPQLPRGSPVVARRPPSTLRRRLSGLVLEVADLGSKHRVPSRPATPNASRRASSLKPRPGRGKPSASSRFPFPSSRFSPAPRRLMKACQSSVIPNLRGSMTSTAWREVPQRKNESMLSSESYRSMWCHQMSSPMHFLFEQTKKMWVPS